MRVGVIGAGVVGGVLIDYFKSISFTVKIRDPKLQRHDSLEDCDAIFICIPVHTNWAGQDQGLLAKLVREAPKEIPLFVRSTVLPGTCDELSRTFAQEVVACPEFLTERTASDDFQRQPILAGVVGSSRLSKLLTLVFPNKKLVFVKNTEAELAKYAHNCFGAMKVAYFNMIYLAAQRLKVDYNVVRSATLLSGYINDVHTLVPGPDGKLGFGGKCFPKDLEAFRKKMFDLGVNIDLLLATESINKVLRC